MSFRGLSSSSNANCNNVGGASSSTIGNVMTMGANAMNFTENQQGNVVLEKLRQQRESGRFCDVVLVVQEKQFPAHRNILAACSPYFDSILRMHKVVKEMVTVTCQSPDVFELLLNYMYSGNVVIDRHNVTELLKLAHNFLVSKLKNYCAEYLDRYLDPQNCLGVKELAEKYNMPGLAKNATHFAEANINAVLSESQDLLEYPICRAEATISEKTFPNVTFEAQLRFVARYVHHRPEEREAYFSGLLSTIRSNLRRRNDSCNSTTLLDFVDKEPLFQQNPSLLLSLLQFARETGLSALKARCERLHHQLTISTANISVNDVSIYFNNGHDAGESGIDGAVTPAADAQFACNNNVLETNGLPSTSHASTNAILVKQEPPDTPPPSGFDQSVIVAPDDSTSFLNIPKDDLLTRQQSDFPPLKIKLRLNDRLSIGKTTEDGKGRRRSTAGRYRTASTENGTDDSGNISAKRGRPPKMRGISMSDGVHSVTTAMMCNGNVESLAVDSLADSSGYADASFELLQEDDDDVDHFSSTSEEDDDSDLEKGETKAEVLFKCPHCVYTSGSQSRIQSHIEKAHRKNRTFSCTICPFECKWNREYYMHMKEHFQGPPFCCDSCDYTAERIQMLLTHRMKHTDERPFQCKECDYRCRTKTNLIAHQRSHTGEKPFTCPACYRSFAIKSTLDQHLATHSDARPFVCDQCSFSTKYQSHLISHKRIHTGDVFHCQYPECTYSSPKKSQLAAHMRTHMAVRAHVCKQCGRSFIEKSHLVRHERIHLQIKPFKCDQCNYASSRRDKLKEHVQKHHVAGAGSSNHYRQQASGPVKNPFCRSGKRGGRSRRLSFVFGGEGPSRNRRLSSGFGRFSASLLAGRPHSSMGFRPITPQVGVLMQDAQGVGAVPMAGGGSIMDFSALLASPTCANDTMVPLATGHAYQPSPFEGGAALNDGDVLLSTQTGGLMSDSPQSTTNSLLSDPFPSAATPASDPLQRPVSLPPLGAQTGEFNLLNSFMAMF